MYYVLMWHFIHAFIFAASENLLPYKGNENLSLKWYEQKIVENGD